jgi:nitrilase
MILTADLNSDEIIRAKLDFDVTGQYGRNDIFNLAVDRRPRRAFDLMWAE